MKLCKDCRKHSDDEKCLHEMLCRVTGNAIRMDCNWMRYREDLCGRSARWFEPKASIFRKGDAVAVWDFYHRRKLVGVFNKIDPKEGRLYQAYVAEDLIRYQNCELIKDPSTHDYTVPK